jgi:hypothetical protein
LLATLLSLLRCAVTNCNVGCCKVTVKNAKCWYFFSELLPSMQQNNDAAIFHLTGAIQNESKSSTEASFLMIIKEDDLLLLGENGF